MTPTDLETLRGLPLLLEEERKTHPQSQGAFNVRSRAAMPALTALLAERDALRERENKIRERMEKWKREGGYIGQYIERSLQSILNDTLSEGEPERTIADEQAEYDQFYAEWQNYRYRENDSAASFLDYLKLRCCVRTLDNTVKRERG